MATPSATAAAAKPAAIPPAAAPAPTAAPAAAVATTDSLTNTGINRRPLFKVARIVTLPLLKLAEGVPVYVKFLDKMFRGKELRNEVVEKNADGSPKAKKEPPIMANVINLETGEQVQIMLGSVLQGILNDDYPGDKYVGKGFMIELTEKKRGRSGGQYNTYKVAELELPAA